MRPEVNEVGTRAGERARAEGPGPRTGGSCTSGQLPRLVLAGGLLLVSVLEGACVPAAGSGSPAGIPVGDPTIAPARQLVGTVDRRFLYRIQATIGEDVASAASVSFIEPGPQPRTVATTVTTDDGGFVLGLGDKFMPAAGAVYYLEAFKGLASNHAGFNAVRVRTLIRWQGSWQSLTAGTVTISVSTTAVAAAAQINTAMGQSVTLGDLMGKLALGQGDAFTKDTFTPVANLSVEDYRGAYDVVNAAIGGDLDPIASIGKANGEFFLKTSGGALGISPGLGADIGETVTISGTSFAATPASNLVLFNGATASVLSVSEDRRSAQVAVPEGATRGPVSVIVGEARSGVVDYPIYGTVRLALSGIPDSSSAARVTLAPPAGSPLPRTVNAPGAEAPFVFKGLIPGTGWTVSGEALDAGGQPWVTSDEIAGPLDPVTLLALPVPGPYAVASGLNIWTLGLAVPAIRGAAKGSF